MFFVIYRYRKTFIVKYKKSAFYPCHFWDYVSSCIIMYNFVIVNLVVIYTKSNYRCRNTFAGLSPLLHCWLLCVCGKLLWHNCEYVSLNSNHRWFNQSFKTNTPLLCVCGKLLWHNCVISLSQMIYDWIKVLRQRHHCVCAKLLWQESFYDG